MAFRHPDKLDVREACVGEAIAIIRDHGLEALSLREVSRRLGVSHQAPYKHYPSREHLLAEVIARAFADFAVALDRRPRHADAYDDLGEMGRVYLDYAMARPLEYRLMFGTPLPEPAAHPEMLRRAQHAFDLLREAIARLPGRPGATAPRDVTLDALHVWSTLHGLAAILRSSVIDSIDLPAATLDALPAYACERIRAALAG